MRLERITWPQAEAYFKEHDTVIVPIGSTECHGRHMPLGTDTLIPNRILDVLEPKTDALIAPTMPYGCTDYLSVYPGTISLGYDVTYQVMHAIVEGLRSHGARRFVILNGHGGNNAVIERLELELQKEGCIAVPINWWTLVWDLTGDWEGRRPWHGGHGGAEETAAVMAIDKNLVDYSEIADSPLKELSPDLPFSSINTIRFKDVNLPIRRYLKDVSDNGWFGDEHPKYATAEWGEELISAAADYMADFIEVLKKVPLE